MYAAIFWDKFTNDTTPYFYTSYHLFYHVVEKVYFTNIEINFFLYAMSGCKFRADLLALFKCKSSNQPPEGSVSVTVTTVVSSVSIQIQGD